ncbi:hypothetical protein [Bacillus vallismortis]|uniref:Pyruvate carboxyltransferase domain-containing protein n=1 Tax=Bacillus vallismortis TaxID=72361 RepID=A0AAP3CLG0_BACVA|nr:hypothetical protein [Bacillus vallismortis]MCY8308039.1 hypothetical protein [Bacillus vallismortis]MCY8318453.1 hypothetical protein [Bacillus vallismortis]MCY8596773.1 hypothetical protein [Bacillus vallismortis]
MSIKLMDVTLRESVHVEGAKINLDAARQVVSGLSKANVDFIEIGYVSSHEGMNLQSCCPIEYIEEMASAIGSESSSQLVLMLHPAQYQEEFLERMKHPSVGMVRLCIPLAKTDASLPVIKELKAHGIHVSANLIRASHANIQDIIVFTEKVIEAGTDYIYLADSNGAMMPPAVSSLFTKLKEHSSVELGFHPHDNLGLASANAIDAIQCGVQFIDGSLYGFGKGPGNLCIETFAAILNRLDLSKKYDICELIQLSRQAYTLFINDTSENSFYDKEEGILSGLHNLNLDVLDKLDRMAQSSGLKLLDLLVILEKQTLVHRAEFALRSTELSQVG